MDFLCLIYLGILGAFLLVVLLDRLEPPEDGAPVGPEQLAFDFGYCPVRAYHGARWSRTPEGRITSVRAWTDCH